MLLVAHARALARPALESLGSWPPRVITGQTQYSVPRRGRGAAAAARFARAVQGGTSGRSLVEPADRVERYCRAHRHRSQLSPNSSDGGRSQVRAVARLLGPPFLASVRASLRLLLLQSPRTAQESVAGTAAVGGGPPLGVSEHFDFSRATSLARWLLTPSRRSAGKGG